MRSWVQQTLLQKEGQKQFFPLEVKSLRSNKFSYTTHTLVWTLQPNTCFKSLWLTHISWHQRDLHTLCKMHSRIVLRRITSSFVRVKRQKTGFQHIRAKVMNHPSSSGWSVYSDTRRHVFCLFLWVGRVMMIYLWWWTKHKKRWASAR